MKANASGTPAKLLVMLEKAMTKSRRRLSTWRSEWLPSTAMSRPSRLDQPAISRLWWIAWR